MSQESVQSLVELVGSPDKRRGREAVTALLPRDDEAQRQFQALRALT